ncbi:MAG: cytochrome c biogenesis protein CcdA, partial [Candidatus Pacebacteria bacterium]|nr:cytochrome c biogenesis protein CcdA [Candidatus Paceibacterota bacterium]
ENSAEFNKRLDILNIPIRERGVPAVFIGDEVFIGDTPIIENFEEKADAFLKDDADENSEAAAIIAEANNEVVPKVEKEVFDEEIIEKNTSTSITLAAVLAGSIVDAVNPCAFAVLIILMMTVMASGDSSRALKTGLAFSSSIFISYLLMGIGLYSALSSGSFGSYFTKGVGVLAIILGLFNLKDWLWYGKGMLMEVPMSWRPTMKKLIRSTTSPLGAFLIGFLVSLFLLPCTSGPYIVVLGMLSDSVQRGTAFLYMVLYNLVFVSPMVIISYLVYRGYDPKRLENLRKKNLKNLHLIAGLILIGMGWFLLV